MGQVCTGLTEALVDAAADKDDDVREGITKSIVDIGRKKHAQVLAILHSYLSKRNKVGVAQAAVIWYPCHYLFTV